MAFAAVREDVRAACAGEGRAVSKRVNVTIQETEEEQKNSGYGIWDMGGETTTTTNIGGWEGGREG
jgi:hypothetical protein